MKQQNEFIAYLLVLLCEIVKAAASGAPDAENSTYLRVMVVFLVAQTAKSLSLNYLRSTLYGQVIDTNAAASAQIEQRALPR